MKYTSRPISFILGSLCLCVSVVSFAAQPPSAEELPLPVPRRLPSAGGPPLEEPAPAPREVKGSIEWAPAGPSREESAPMPREQSPSPPPLLLPSVSRADPLAEVQRLHQEIDGLRLEREAMLLEEMDLITAKEIKSGKGDEMRQLRRRVTELLTKAAQQNKKQMTAEASPEHRATTIKKGGKQPLPDGRGSVKPDQPRTTPSAPPSLPVPSTQPTPIAQPAKQADNSATILTEAPVDPLSLAQSLFLAGDHAAALNAYRQLEQEEQKTDERIAIQYMIACCLRKLGKLDEAALLYREVANSRGNDILVENAQWYLRAMKDRRELETQLDDMRQRRQSLMPRKP